MADGIDDLLNPARLNLARARVVMAVLALSMVMATIDRGWAKAAAPALGVQPSAQLPLPPAPQPPQSIEVPPAPVERENPGLINEIGKLFEKSKSILPLKSPGETMNDLSDIARPSSMVTGRAACVVASNGAPDCKIGADRLCQSKGFKEGKSLDTDASEKCSPLVYLPGHKRGPNDCKTENFVTRALCQ
ncbi:hypothetical protein MTX26_05495 [Bradyrhizobium sp. ISRA443]|uniref:hypothetical protein n=1 Tax=unclassified Bradyrhizobium TaxID=2631580 RepID=UPI0024790041|nr:MULTISPECIES: hypothetical protein [unclassified Bradyrhizobium]WGS00307.1 hypothetical protein MTX23_05495 [Bradyrhizobium sp. ISRA436]WGS07196.1 hypothetical protein MTX18_05495 [Bradyrhizobium sp. ISRA437]WGS14081.1 hypothetical protein MTX26_05495 [Bradyrhizobium sp. ISRA443]